jgi:hypothetical protein
MAASVPNSRTSWGSFPDRSPENAAVIANSSRVSSGVKDAVLGAMANGDVPFDRLVRGLKVKRVVVIRCFRSLSPMGATKPARFHLT